MVHSIDLSHEAFRSSDGELAWPRERLPAVMQLLSNQSLAVLGGELWVVVDDVIHAGFRLRSGGDAVCCWSVRERAGSESWPDFVERCAAETSEIIRALAPEQDIVLTPDARLYYNLTWGSQAEYEQLKKERAG